MALTGRSDWVVAYDVSDNRTRLRLAARLEARGPRVLHSVFEIAAPDPDAEDLLEWAGGLLGEDDRLLLLPTCDRCGRATLGQGIEPEPDQVIIPGVAGLGP